MNAPPDDRQNILRMEGILAALLRYGALVASACLAFGMILTAFNDTFGLIHVPAAVSNGCLSAGIVLLISLPVLRVAIMTAVFLLEKDYRFAAISGAVLVIIAVGFLLGSMNSRINIL